MYRLKYLYVLLLMLPLAHAQAAPKELIKGPADPSTTAGVHARAPVNDLAMIAEVRSRYEQDHTTPYPIRHFTEIDADGTERKGSYDPNVPFVVEGHPPHDPERWLVSKADNSTRFRLVSVDIESLKKPAEKQKLTTDKKKKNKKDKKKKKAKQIPGVTASPVFDPSVPAPDLHLPEEPAPCGPGKPVPFTLAESVNIALFDDVSFVVTFVDSYPSCTGGYQLEGFNDGQLPDGSPGIAMLTMWEDGRIEGILATSDHFYKIQPLSKRKPTTRARGRVPHVIFEVDPSLPIVGVFDDGI